jgi:hypothetical protein
MYLRLTPPPPPTKQKSLLRKNILLLISYPWYTKQVRFYLSLPISANVSIFTVSAFNFLTLTATIPILFNVILQHTYSAS